MGDDERVAAPCADRVTSTRNALSVTLRPAEGAEARALAARFDIVLAPAR